MSPREQGLDALKAGDSARATELLRAAVAQAPQDGHAWGGLGVALCQSGRVEEGVAAFEKAVSLVPNQASLHFNLGRGCERLNRLPAALVAYRRAAELDPSHSQAAASVARLGAAAPPAPPSPPAANHASAPAPSSATPPAPVPGLSDFALPGAAAPPPPMPGSPSPHPGATAASPWTPPPPAPPPPAGVAASPFAHPTLTGLGATPPPGPPASQSHAPAPLNSSLAPIPSRPTPGAWPPSAFSGVPDGTPPFGTNHGLGGSLVPAGPYGSTAPPPLTDASYPSSSNSGGWAAKLGGIGLAGILAIVFIGFKAVRLVDRGGRLFGSSLNSTRPGARVSDSQLGYSIAFPEGFNNPAPTRIAGTGIGRRTSGYSATGTAGEAFVSATEVAAARANGDPRSLTGEVRNGLVKARRLTVTGSMPASHVGRMGEEFRFTMSLAGKTRYGRARVIVASPRVYTVGCILGSERDLESRGIRAFFDSLDISSASLADVAGLSGGVPGSSQFNRRATPGLGRPNPGAGGYQAPPMPEMPQIDTPDGPTMPGRPGFQPGRPRYGPGGPGGGYNPGGPGGAGSPNGGPPGGGFGPGGPNGGPPGGGFGPGGPNGGPPGGGFGPGGPPGGFGPGGPSGPPGGFGPGGPPGANFGPGR